MYSLFDKEQSYADEIIESIETAEDDLYKELVEGIPDKGDLNTKLYDDIMKELDNNIR